MYEYAVDEKENTYAKSYQNTPEKLKVAKVSAKLASKVLNKEDWPLRSSLKR